MFIQAKLSYDSVKRIEALAPSAYAELQARYPDFLPKDQTEAIKILGWSDRGEVISTEDAQKLMDEGYEIEVKRFRSLVPKLPRHVEEAKRAQSVFYLHVPSFGLLNITEVDYLEDCCTRELQDKLKSGWRIVAVCPPLDQRRPTYIIGRGDQP